MIHDVVGCTLYITRFSDFLLFVVIYIGKYFRVIYEMVYLNINCLIQRVLQNIY